MKRITVLLAEDHTLVREGFRKILELEDDFEVVGEAEDGRQAVAMALWYGGSAATRLARASPELSKFAGKHGLSLIFDDNALAEDESSIFASDLHQREVALTPTLQHILEQSERGYQHWGLNE